MAIDVTYKTERIFSLADNGSVSLSTGGNYCEADIELVCEDAIFTPMPPDESYKRETVYQDAEKFPSHSNSVNFQDVPIITIRQRNIPSNLDKSKFTYEAYRVGDTQHTENLIDSVTEASATQTNIVYSIKHSWQFVDNTVFLCYYDGVKVFEYLMSFGGYIRVTWNLVNDAQRKLYRAFWAYALQAKVVFG